METNLPQTPEEKIAAALGATAQKKKPLPQKRIPLILGAGIIVAALLGAFFIYNQLRVRDVVIATNEEGSQSYDYAVALAEVIRETDPRINLVILQTLGSNEGINLIQSGKADLTIAQADAPTGSNVRTVALLYPQIYHLVVRSDSSIQTPADLLGKRVATPAVGGGSHSSFLHVMDYYGFTEDDVTIVPIDDRDVMNAALLDGEVDAVFRATTLDSSSLHALIDTGRVRLVPFDQYDAMKLTAPALAQYVIPRGTYRAADPIIPESDLTVIGVPTALYSSAGLDKSLVRSITQILFEHQNQLAALNNLGVYLATPLESKTVLPSIHVGALAYYDREKPGFFERYYNELTILATFFPLAASVYFALRARLATLQRNRAYRYNLQIAALLAAMMSSPSAARAKQTELKLLEILEDVLNDMNEGEIDISDLQAFSFVWDKAMEAVRYREAVLSKRRKSAKRKDKLLPK